MKKNAQTLLPTHLVQAIHPASMNNTDARKLHEKLLTAMPNQFT